MKKLLFIAALIPFFGKAQMQVTILQNDTTIQVGSIKSMTLNTCSSFCSPAVKYTWANRTSNPSPVVFSSTTTPTATISGFNPGIDQVILTATELNGQSVADTVTLVFTAPPVVIPPVDSAGIIAAYVKTHPAPIIDSNAIGLKYVIAHPCPPIPACPAPLPQRSATGQFMFVSGGIKVSYDDGSTSIISVK